MSEGQPTVVVCDDNQMTRVGMSKAVRASHFELVGEAEHAVDALHLAEGLQPSAVIIRHELPGTTGIEVIPDLKRLAPGVEVVIVSRDPAARERAMDTGAFEYVLDLDLDQLEVILVDLHEWIEHADERDRDERRKGRDRRTHQDWSKVTSERRGIDRRTHDESPPHESDVSPEPREERRQHQDWQAVTSERRQRDPDLEPDPDA